jgi:hypothetical protein
MWGKAGNRDCSCSDHAHTRKILANMYWVLYHAMHGTRREACDARHGSILSTEHTGPEGLFSRLNNPAIPLISSHI